jgi:single-strand DNA-binding protein
MASFNKVILMGNVTRDPELKTTAKGTSIAKLGLAISRKWSTESGEKKEETTFVDIDFMGKIAETVGKFVKKGDPIHVDGRLKLDQWDDKKTGEKRTKLGVWGEGMQFLSRPNTPAEGGGANINRANQAQAAASPPRPAVQAAAPVANRGSNSIDDDLPF